MSTAGVTDSDTDYSDFEYQQLDISVGIGQSLLPGNANNLYLATVSPIEDIGGLDNNEVAELVGYDMQVSVEIEDETNDQDVGTHSEMRGAMGINLNQEGGHARLASTKSGQSADIDSTSDDRILQLFTARASLPFDDQTNGPGGAGANEDDHREHYYRQTHGRGPVLDQTDNMAWSGNVIVGDSVINVTGKIRVELIWDIAEVSDAGRAFSVPNSM